MTRKRRAGLLVHARVEGLDDVLALDVGGDRGLELEARVHVAVGDDARAA